MSLSSLTTVDGNPDLVGERQPSSTAAGSGSAVFGFRPEIDALRAVAVLMVAFSHWLPKTASVINYGTIGVQIFFVISGYVITRSHLDQFRPGRKSDDVRRFYLRRAFRILPAFYLAIAVLWIAYPNFHSSDALIHGFFLTNLYDAVAGQFLFPVSFWSICVEQQFYLFFPALMWMLHHRGSNAVLWIVILIGPISRFAVQYYSGNIQELLYLPTSALDQLALGIYLARKERSSGFVDGGSLPYFLAASLLFLANLWIGFQTLFPSVVAVTTAGVLYGDNLSRALRLLPKILQEVLKGLGRISYGFYLYHLIVSAFLYGYVYQSFNVIEMAGLFLVVSIVVSIVSFVALERPLTRLGRRY